MKRASSIFALILLSALPAIAHVGSPNVFFDGRAGDYQISAVLRPPAALPGVVQVSVRVEDASASAVTVTPRMWNTGRDGAPPPINAQRVAGETNLWSAELWLLRPGPYTVLINVSGADGTGVAAVPLNAAPTERREMTTTLRLTLGLLGLLVFVGAVSIANSLGRESHLEPGAKISPTHLRRGRLAGAVVALILVVGIGAGAVRWQNMDLAYRNSGLARPEPVLTTVRAGDSRAILELRQADESITRPSWASLVPDHGKLMHLFLLREPEQNAFAHLHPMRMDSRTFSLNLPALPAGEYQLYGDVTFENGMSQTLIARVTLPELAGAMLDLPPAMTNLTGDVVCGYGTLWRTNTGGFVVDMDDSWHAGQSTVTGVEDNLRRPGLISRLMGGYTLLFENADEVAAGREASMRFAAFGPDGREVPLQNYMGMRGHAAVRRDDGSVFAHLHPVGSFSMASQEVFVRRETGAGRPINPITWDGSPAKAGINSAALHRVSFPYEFPKPGAYRVWVQVRIDGRVLTGVFDLARRARE